LICGRATKAAEKFAAASQDRGGVIEGGTQPWIQAGLPVDRGVAKVISLERQVHIAAGALVLLGVLLGWLVHRALFGLSEFVGAGLIFAGITDFCGMGLLLARVPWNNYAHA
jgi:rhodanese-related sulfurtransferase